MTINHLIAFSVFFCSFQLSAQVEKDSSFIDKNIYWKGKTAGGKMTGEWIGLFGQTDKIAGKVNYADGLKDGTETRFQHNGKLQSIYQYKAGQLNGSTIHFTQVKADTLGIIQYSNNLPDGNWLLYNWRGVLMETIHWKNGVPDKTHLYNQFTIIGIPPIEYDFYVDVCRKYIGIYYENIGTFKKPSVIDTTSKNISPPPPPPPPPGANGTLCFAEEMPVFPGGEGALQTFIINSLRYPISAKEAGKQGTVYLVFQVNKDGSLSNEQISKPVRDAPELTGEALRLISLMPDWSPGKMDGKLITVQIGLPIRFVLK